MRLRDLIWITGLLVAATVPAFGQASPFVGEWMLEISQDDGRVRTGLLSIEESPGGLIGFLENGPVTLEIAGDSIAMAIDTRTSGGGSFNRYFNGVLADNEMSGKFGPPADASEAEALVCRRFPLSCTQPTGSWTAIPYSVPMPGPAGPSPVDVSGMWGATSGTGMLKWSSSLTDKGQAWLDKFVLDLDLPSLRCGDTGIFWHQRGAPEIFQQPHKLTFVSASYVRHIYLDDRSAPEFHPHTPMGFSSGHWEGDHLVVETSHIAAGVRGYMGEVYSDNARMLERYWLNKDGILSGIMELHDPEHFSRPPLQRTRWAKRDPDSVSIFFPCDPDSFFRQIYTDGLMQEYIDRADRRF